MDHTSNAMPDLRSQEQGQVYAGYAVAPDMMYARWDAKGCGTAAAKGAVPLCSAACGRAEPDIHGLFPKKGETHIQTPRL